MLFDCCSIYNSHFYQNKQKSSYFSKTITLSLPKSCSLNQTQHKTVSTLPSPTLLPRCWSYCPSGTKRANSQRKGQLDSTLYGETIWLPSVGNVRKPIIRLVSIFIAIVAGDFNVLTLDIVGKYVTPKLILRFQYDFITVNIQL